MTPATKAPRCKHGMVAGTCGICEPPPAAAAARAPRHLPRGTTTVRSKGALDTRPYATKHYVVVRTHRHNGGPEPRVAGGFENLTAETTFVHITGLPFLWAIELILERAPNVRTIQMIPSELAKLNERHRALCADRHVELAGGHCRPECAWDEDEVCRSSDFEPRRRFLFGLEGEQRLLYDELVAMGFESVAIAERYYCLDGGERMTLNEISEMFGFSTASVASAHINAVLRYLDPTYQTGDVSVQRARALAERVERLRVMLRSGQARQERLAEVGLAIAPSGLPLARLDLYVALVRAAGDGRAAAMAQNDARAWQAIRLRFGLDEPDPLHQAYRTLEEVGRILGVTRERARQLEERGLRALDIRNADDTHHQEEL